MNKKSRKLLTWALVVAMVITQMLFSTSAFAATTRYPGNDRCDTAAKVALAGWANGADTVVVATGYEFADALVAAPLAKAYNAPILLTEGNALNAYTKSAITTLKAKNAIIVGGTVAVSAAVENELAAMGLTVSRIFGTDRIATSLEVAKALDTKLGAAPTNAFLTTGLESADALSASSLAAAQGWPILLTYPNAVDANVSAYLTGKTVYVLGGTNAVSAEALAGFTGFERVWGVDRYATNLAVANKFADKYNDGKIFVATGLEYADALAGSVLAANSNSFIVLADGSLTADMTAFLKANLTSTTELVVLGGTNAVPASIVSAIEAIINGSALTVNSVEATTKIVSGNADSHYQYLGFTINNGKTVSIDDLEAAGYTVEFQSNEDVLFDNAGDTDGQYSNNTGYVSEDDLVALLGGADEETFTYAVVISKDGEAVATSANQTVKVTDKLITADAIDSVTIREGNATTFPAISSGKIELLDTPYVTKVTGTNRDGHLSNEITTYTLSSSNPFVASVDATGLITPHAVGKFVLTVTSGVLTKDVSLEVVSGARKAYKATLSTSSLALSTAAGSIGAVLLNVKDQYGDPWMGYVFGDAANVTTSSGGTIIATAAYDDPTGTDKSGDATVRFTTSGNTGEGTFKFLRADGTTMTSVKITNSSSTVVNSYKLQLVDPSASLTIDRNIDADYTDADLYLNKYTSSGALIGPETTVDTTALGVGYELSVENPTGKTVINLADVTVDANGDINIAPTDANGSVDLGTAYLVAKNDGVEIARVAIKVVDSSVTITGVKFESNIEVADGDASIDLANVIKASNISVNGTAGDSKVKITNDGTIYIDGDDDDAYTDAEDDVYLGKVVVAIQSGITGPITIAGDTITGFVAGDDGKLTVGVQKRYEKTPSYTTTITVK